MIADVVLTHIRGSGAVEGFLVFNERDDCLYFATGGPVGMQHGHGGRYESACNESEHPFCIVGVEAACNDDFLPWADVVVYRQEHLGERSTGIGELRREGIQHLFAVAGIFRLHGELAEP